ncbi:MAG: 4'-phosphopantetheinyl transferase family protein [Solirubrobacteraceae bacterium]
MSATAEDTWAPGPLRPLLGEGAIHVWRAELTALAEDLGELLCSDERARAERFVNERDGELWRRSRGLLRALLGRYLQQDPGSLRFATGEHGKPALIEDASPHPADASPRLAFNMSHSAQLALYAFSAAWPVGVDVEVARRPIDEVAIAERELGADEARRLQALDPPVRRREFTRAWVRHEAGLKCRGTGLGAAAAAAGAGTLWVAELEVGKDAAAAVACERPPRELCCWRWPSS